MISNFLWPILDDMDTEEMWFQKDGTTCRISGTTISLLCEQFDGRLISIRGNQQWPPRSCDLTPCDFFLWGYIKSLVYANKRRTLLDLKQEV
ncbi:unnamed protein product [Macrosiphum euphorbiae]|nr:unnamed protein product [Macrosiphum euphorbiae]